MANYGAHSKHKKYKKMKGGYYVSYIDKKGKLQKGRVMHSEQLPAFKKINKSLVRLCTDDLNDQVNDEGKKIKALVITEKLKLIGFID